MIERFKTIVADPAWPFRDQLPGPKRGAASHYATMRPDKIERYLMTARLGKQLLWDVIAADARLFLWRVAAMQDEASDVAFSWDFTVKAELVWVKTRDDGTGLRIGMGRQVRNAHETCLIATRGRPERLSASVPSVFYAPRGEHSAKPDAFYEIVERFSPGPYLELFGRRRRPNWTVLGDQLPALAEAAE